MKRQFQQAQKVLKCMISIWSALMHVKAILFSDATSSSFKPKEENIKINNSGRKYIRVNLRTVKTNANSHYRRTYRKTLTTYHSHVNIKTLILVFIIVIIIIIVITKATI